MMTLPKLLRLNAYICFSNQSLHFTTKQYWSYLFTICWTLEHNYAYFASWNAWNIITHTTYKPSNHRNNNVFSVIKNQLLTHLTKAFSPNVTKNVRSNTTILIQNSNAHKIGCFDNLASKLGQAHLQFMFTTCVKFYSNCLGNVVECSNTNL